jgi:hypothetical protein
VDKAVLFIIFNKIYEVKPLGKTAGKLIVSCLQAVYESASYTISDKKSTYPQNSRQLLRLEHTELHTCHLILTKSSLKTGVYGVNLYFFVDNLCKCVEKHENNSV